MRCEVIVHAFGVKQHFYSIQADAAAVGVLLRGSITPIKRIKDMLELLRGQWFAGVFDG